MSSKSSSPSSAMPRMSSPMPGCGRVRRSSRSGAPRRDRDARPGECNRWPWALLFPQKCEVPTRAIQQAGATRVGYSRESSAPARHHGALHRENRVNGRIFRPEHAANRPARGTATGIPTWGRGRMSCRAPSQKIRRRKTDAAPVHLHRSRLRRPRQGGPDLGIPEEADEGAEHRRIGRPLLSDEVPMPPHLHGRPDLRGVSGRHVVSERHPRKCRAHHPGAPDRRADRLATCVSRRTRSNDPLRIWPAATLYLRPPQRLPHPDAVSRRVPRRGPLAHAAVRSGFLRIEGHDWPTEAETMVGMRRLDNLHQCTRTVLQEGVPGDFVETGVWRGGCAILIGAILEAYGDTQRSVWLASSFQESARAGPGRVSPGCGRSARDVDLLSRRVHGNGAGELPALRTAR